MYTFKRVFINSSSGLFVQNNSASINYSLFTNIWIAGSYYFFFTNNIISSSVIHESLTFSKSTDGSYFFFLSRKS